MVKSLKAILITWNATHTERVKLQHTYLVVAIVGIFAAGLVGIFSDRFSRLIVNASLIILVVLIINVLAWAVLYGMLISKIPKPNPPSKQVRRAKK